VTGVQTCALPISTTEAVLSDLFDLRRDLINSAEAEQECVA